MRTREQEEELDRELHNYWSKESVPKEEAAAAADEDNMDTGEKLGQLTQGPKGFS